MTEYRISETPRADRPRERLESLGPASLTVVELVAILLGTGHARNDVLGVARKVLATSGGSLRDLARSPSDVLSAIPGVGRVKAGRVSAALELGRRMVGEKYEFREQIRSPADIFSLFGRRMGDLAVEEFRLLSLDTQNRIRQDRLITRGILNGSLVHPREVFRAAITDAAAGIVVIHNHPSGDPTPSDDDRAVTKQLADAGKLLNIPLYDHVVVGADSYFSFAEANLL